MHPTTWKASGHVDSFSDPQIDCRNCKNRIRADHYLEKFGYDLDRVSVKEINKILDELRLQKKFMIQIANKGLSTSDLIQTANTILALLGYKADSVSMYELLSTIEEITGKKIPPFII